MEQHFKLRFLGLKGTVLSAAVRCWFVRTLACVFLFPSFVWAGDPGPLCQHVRRLPLIVEVELEIKDPPPLKYLEKNWQPERSHYKNTLATARIVSVYRGKTAINLPFASGKINLTNLSAADWKIFFAANKVRVLTGGIEGWLSDDGICNASVCRDYEPFLNRLKNCL